MKAVSVYAMVLTVFCGILFFSSNLNKEAGTADQQFNNNLSTDKNSLPQIIQSVRLSQGINLGGEELPMGNFDAKERLEREFLVNSYWHSSTLLFLKHANRYFPVIEPILAEQCVPDDFKYLAVCRIGFANVKSPAGARGVWQFMAPAAKTYGLISTTKLMKDIILKNPPLQHVSTLKMQKHNSVVGRWQLLHIIWVCQG